MAIKPTLFNTPMTQAIQAGTKTETRRVIKPQPTEHLTCGEHWRELLAAAAAPCHPGDVLWVRETWADYDRYYYKATEPDAAEPIENGDPRWFKWRPSIHMPKEAARLFLRVTGVRVERAENMNLDDFLSEGVCLLPEAFNDPGNAYSQAKRRFSAIWNSTIKKPDLDRYGWDANPWVWVIEFERCERPEGWPGEIGP